MYSQSYAGLYFCNHLIPTAFGGDSFQDLRKEVHSMQAITSFIEKRKSLFLRIASVVLPLIILLTVLAPTAFAQTTYVITDGDYVRVHTTNATNPVDVLSEAGFELGEDDTYTSQPGDGVSEITVQRSQMIDITYCGKTIQASSYGETLETLLNRLGLNAQGEYSASLPLNTKTYDGMEVVIDCVVEMKQTYTVDVPYETVYCNDPGLPEGVEQVRVAGVTGQMLRTANVVYVNSQEVSHTVVEETVTVQPVNQIIMVGTAVVPDTTLDNRMPTIGDGVIVTADGEILTYSHSAQFRATAYTHTDEGCNMITSTGTTVRLGTVAVDPSVIPYGTRMFIISNDGKFVYGVSAAEDCGGAIKNDRLDLYFATNAECMQFGVRDCTVYFLE